MSKQARLFVDTHDQIYMNMGGRDYPLSFNEPVGNILPDVVVKRLPSFDEVGFDPDELIAHWDAKSNSWLMLERYENSAAGRAFAEFVPNVS